MSYLKIYKMHFGIFRKILLSTEMWNPEQKLSKSSGVEERWSGIIKYVNNGRVLRRKEILKGIERLVRKKEEEEENKAKERAAKPPRSTNSSAASQTP